MVNAEAARNVVGIIGNVISFGRLFLSPVFSLSNFYLDAFGDKTNGKIVLLPATMLCA